MATVHRVTSSSRVLPRMTKINHRVPVGRERIPASLSMGSATPRAKIRSISFLGVRAPTNFFPSLARGWLAAVPKGRLITNTLTPAMASQFDYTSTIDPTNLDDHEKQILGLRWNAILQSTCPAYLVGNQLMLKCTLSERQNRLSTAPSCTTSTINHRFRQTTMSCQSWIAPLTTPITSKYSPHTART
jgi:hypothetical protein